jgi:hypothetical protein
MEANEISNADDVYWVSSLTCDQQRQTIGTFSSWQAAVSSAFAVFVEEHLLSVHHLMHDVRSWTILFEMCHLGKIGVSSTKHIALGALIRDAAGKLVCTPEEEVALEEKVVSWYRWMMYGEIPDEVHAAIRDVEATGLPPPPRVETDGLWQRMAGTRRQTCALQST